MSAFSFLQFCLNFLLFFLLFLSSVAVVGAIGGWRQGFSRNLWTRFTYPPGRCSPPYPYSASRLLRLSRVAAVQTTCSYTRHSESIHTGQAKTLLRLRSTEFVYKYKDLSPVTGRGRSFTQYPPIRRTISRALNPKMKVPPSSASSFFDEAMGRRAEPMIRDAKNIKGFWSSKLSLSAQKPFSHWM